MLDDLRALRAVQDEQERALDAGDTECFTELCGRARAILTALPGQAPPDEAAGVRALAGDVMAMQASLERAARVVQASLADDLTALVPGREALAGYRPPVRDTARLFDRVQ